MELFIKEASDLLVEKDDVSTVQVIYWHCDVPLYWEESRRLEVSGKICKRIYANFEDKVHRVLIFQIVFLNLKNC
jgi:hypothetical protein